MRSSASVEHATSAIDDFRKTGTKSPVVIIADARYAVLMHAPVTPPPSFRAALRVGSEEHAAAIVGLSVFGCTLRSPVIVPLGTFLPLRLIGKDDDFIQLQGLVTSVRPRLHVRFEALNTRQRDELSAFVADIRQQGAESTQPLMEHEQTSEIDIRAQVAALANEVARLREVVPDAVVAGNAAPVVPVVPFGQGTGFVGDDHRTPTKNLRPISTPTSLPTKEAANASSSSATTSTIVALMAAIDPMLWGLEEAARHFESHGTDDEGARHLRHLRLLERLLRRLNTEIQHQEAERWHDG